jgi:hypothetical protein
MSKINTKIIKKKKLHTADNLEKQISGSFRCTKYRSASVPLLYRLVYSSKTSFITVFVLLLSFVFQGASLTYADEIIETTIANEEPTSNVSEITLESEIIVEESIADIVETSISTNDSNIDQINIDNFVAEDEITTEDLLIGDSLVEYQQGSVPDTSPPLDDPPIISEDISVIEIDDESLPNNDVLSVIDSEDNSTTTPTSTIAVEGGGEDSAGSGVDDEPLLETGSSSESLPEENATTTPEIDLAYSSSTDTASTSEPLEEAVTVTNSDTEFTFNRDECTTLASGSFYCLKAEADLLEDALFSAPDIDGDLEIYLVRDGVRSQVTSNLVDDAAPFFDQNSDTIVWHRLIDDRYQIISYDISSGEESQLTNGEANSMEPTRQGKYTVWQNWSNNNWNVVLFDGKEQRTITESSAHDIAPYVHGSLVVWNRYSSGQDKTIEMYDMISETYVTVDDPEGLSVTNPRMVFVYDSLHPNGDVVTKGYDMISRKFIQLDTLPRQLPDEIPESESTGETRALIQSKPTVKSDEAVQNNTATSSGPTPPNLPSATSTDPLTLDLTATSTLSKDSVTSPVLEIPVMAEYELIIPPLELPPVETVQE